MELLVFFVAVVALCALSDRFGADNRDGLRSHEAELAALGFHRELSLPVKQEPWMR